MDEAEVIYGNALDAVDAISIEAIRINSLLFLIRGSPLPSIFYTPARLISASAPRLVRMAQSIKDELRRSEALVAIAGALPN